MTDARRNNHRTKLAAVLLALGAASTAHASGIGVVKKSMEFDVTQPARENYREQVLGESLIDHAIDQAWSQVSDQALAPVVTWMSAADRIGPGMTARDIRITLGQPGSIALQSGAPANPRLGKLVVTIPGNRMELTSTHPASRGKWMDPRIRLDFDMTLTVDFGIVSSSPYVRASEAVITAGNVRVLPLNDWAAIGFSVDALISQMGGKPTIAARIRDAFAAARIPVTASFNSQLSAQAGLLALPAGEFFNGGAVEPARVVIAAYRIKPLPGADLAVSAWWPKALGELMNDCRPVGAGAQWISGPRPYGGGGVPPRQRAQALRADARSDRGDSYSCLSIVRVPSGAPVEITWAQPIRVAAGGPSSNLLRVAVQARPANFSNPVHTQGIDVYKLALSREVHSGIGVRLNAGAAARANPGDPVERRAKEPVRINPADSTRTNAAAAARVAPTEKAALNPQPLPPTDAKAQPKVRTDALRDAVDRNAVGSALSPERAIAVPQTELQRVQPH